MLPTHKSSWMWHALNPGNAENLPPPRSGAASVVVKGKLFIFGGYGGGTGRLDDFWAYDFEKQQWEMVEVLSAKKPGCRENNGVVISDSSRVIYLFGGYNGDCWLNDLWKYDIETKHWECIQESSTEDNPGRPTRRFGYVSVVHNSKFVLFGGFDGTQWLNDMYVFDFRSSSWSEMQTTGPKPTARSCPAWAKDDKFVYIQGGYDGVERKSDFFALDLEHYQWTEMPCLGTPPSPRYFHSCCLYGNRMYLYGGYSGSERLSDMYAYDFDTSHWSRIDSYGEAPSGRSSLVAQVYKDNIYVFGGYNGNVVLNDFFRFKLQPIGVPPPALVQDYGKLINNSEMSDVTFTIAGKHVYGHKAILAIRSEYFRVMLCGGMREAESSVPIEIPDVSYDVFLKVLEYLYTDVVVSADLELSIHLLIASEQFLLERLKCICETIIQNEISTATVVNILVASHRHQANSLKELALEFIIQHLDDPSVNDGLNELKTEPDLLLEIIRRNQAQAGNDPGPFGSNSDWGARR